MEGDNEGGREGGREGGGGKERGREVERKGKREQVNGASTDGWGGDQGCVMRMDILAETGGNT